MRARWCSKYLILDVLGQGTFGQVVKCQNMKTHEIVAVKVVKNKPAYFNQSMMELGATVCLPRAPLCLGCPWQRWCHTRGEHPVPARRAQQRQHSARGVWLRGTAARQQVLLVQRAADASLMAGMWELPVYHPGSNPSRETTVIESPEFTVRHAITVTNHVVDVYVRSGTVHGLEGEWVPVRELSERPLTGLTRKVLRRVGCLP